MTLERINGDPAAFFAKADWTLGVIGVGYVGLPLLAAASRRGLGVIGYDIDGSKVARLRDGESPVGDVADERLRLMLDAGAVFTTDPNELRRADAIFVCVPSPLGPDRLPDLSYIDGAASVIAGVARPGHLVTLESTTYPGTTRDRIVPAVGQAGLVLDEDVWVAYSPERLSPGDQGDPASIPKVVGGITPMSTEVAAAAYRRIVGEVHTVSSARAAEMTKLLENIYRSVNIGLINELAQLAHFLEIDIWEVIDAAATKPFGFQPFFPGPGVGGHCIPLDPQYLAWRARRDNYPARFIDLADDVNCNMPSYTRSRIVDILNDQGIAVRNARILGIGIAYKSNVGDDRESASVRVLKELAGRGADVTVLDPLVGSERIVFHGFKPAEVDDDLGSFDVAVVLTDHDTFDYEAFADAVPVVFDTRGAFRRRGIHRPNVITL